MSSGSPVPCVLVAAGLESVERAANWRATVGGLPVRFCFLGATRDDFSLACAVLGIAEPDALYIPAEQEHHLSLLWWGRFVGLAMGDQISLVAAADSEIVQSPCVRVTQPLRAGVEARVEISDAGKRGELPSECAGACADWVEMVSCWECCEAILFSVFDEAVWASGGRDASMGVSGKLVVVADRVASRFKSLSDRCGGVGAPPPVRWVKELGAALQGNYSRSDLTRRLVMLSALMHVRAVRAASMSQFLEAVLSAWRSVDILAHAVCVDSGGLTPSGLGKFGWCNGRVGYVKSADILQDIGWVSSEVMALKDARNEAITCHGFRGAAEATALRAIKASRDIATKDPQAALWAACVHDLAWVPDWKEFASALVR